MSIYSFNIENNTERNKGAAAVIKELNYLVPNVNGKDIALLCYEKPSDFCHRHLVAEWLNQNGFKCEEWRTNL